MKKVFVFTLIFLILSGMFVYADVDFTIERVGLEQTVDFACNGEICVAVGRRGQILFSEDFVNWEYCNFDNYTVNFTNVFWLGQYFISIARFNSGGCEMYISNNGIDWEYKSTLKLSSSDNISACYLLSENEFLLEKEEFSFFYETNVENTAGWVVRDFQVVSQVKLSDYADKIQDFDTKGYTYDRSDASLNINGEKFRWPQEDTDYISSPTSDQAYSYRNGIKTKLYGMTFVVGQLDFSNYNGKYRPPMISPYILNEVPDFMKEVYGEESYLYTVGNNFIIWRKNSNIIYVYDLEWNLVNTKKFEDVILKVYKPSDGCCEIYLQSSGYTEASYYSFDLENWSKERPVTVYDYETVYETDQVYREYLGMWELKYDDENKKYRLLTDGIYGINLNIPFPFEEYGEYNGRFLFWEDDENLYIQDGVLKMSTSKKAFYHSVMEMENKPYVVLNDKVLGFDVPPVLEDDRMLVPMRFVFEQMGAEVEWDQDTQTATAKKDGINISFTIDNILGTVNGIETKMDVPARLIQGKTMIPIRFLSENLGYTVDWIEESNIALIYI